MVHAKILLIMALMVSATVSGCGDLQQHADVASSSSQPTEAKTFSTDSASAATKSESFDFGRHVGWIHRACLAIKNGSLPAATVVQVISLERPQRAYITKVVGVATMDSGCAALAPDRRKVNERGGRSFYALDLDKSQNLLAVGVVGLDAELTSVHDRVHVDLNRNGKVLIADSCQTSEGIQFYLMPFNQGDKTRMWSDYYYLGYDTKPTCLE